MTADEPVEGRLVDPLLAKRFERLADERGLSQEARQPGRELMQKAAQRLADGESLAEMARRIGYPDGVPPLVANPPSVPVESRPDQFAQFRGTVIFQAEWNLPPQMFCTDCGWDSGDCPTKYLSARAEYHLNETNGAHHVFWFQRIIRRYEDVGPAVHDAESDAASWSSHD